MTRPLRIGYDASVTLLPGPGGIGRYTLELLRALVAQPDLELVVLLNSWRNRPDNRHEFLRTAPNVKIVERRIPGPLLIKSWLYWGTMSWERLTGEECDIVHAPASYIPPAKCPVVVTVHDLDFLRETGKLDTFGAGYFRAAFPEQLPLMDAIVTPSRFVADQVVETYDIPADHVHAIHSGIDTNLFCPGETFDSEELEERGITPNYVLAITGNVPRKRPELLAETAELLLQDPNLTIVAIGFPSDRLPYRHPRFRMLQNITDEDLAYYYRAAGVTLLTTREEGFGFPLVESLACGTPVVCGQNSSLAEVAGTQPHFVAEETAQGYAEAVRMALAQNNASPKATHQPVTWAQTAEDVVGVYRKVVHLS